MKRKFRRPSPAMVIAIVALIAALGGTAIAGGVLNKKKVNKIINNRAPALKVGDSNKLGGQSASAFQTGAASDFRGDLNSLTTQR